MILSSLGSKDPLGAYVTFLSIYSISPKGSSIIESKFHIHHNKQVSFPSAVTWITNDAIRFYSVSEAPASIDPLILCAIAYLMLFEETLGQSSQSSPD